MKIKHIFLIGILVIILLVVGCQTTQESSDNVINEVMEKDQFVPSNTNNDEIRILGEEGFDKYEVTVKSGESIRFINQNPAREIVTVVFKKNVKLTNSGLIEYKDNYVKEFDEPGIYEFWTVGYGIEGRVIVEE